MQRPNYASLRSEHQKALDALHDRIGVGSQSPAPEPDAGIQREPERAQQPGPDGIEQGLPGGGQAPQQKEVEQKFPGAAHEVAGRSQKASLSVEEPSRPEGHPSQSKSPGWTDRGDMVNTARAANEYNKAAQAHQASLHELREKIDKRADGEGPDRVGQGPDKSPDKGDDLTPKPPDIER